MANIQVSVFIPEEWVKLADEVAGKEDRSRNYVMSRWLESGIALEAGGEWKLVDVEDRLKELRAEAGLSSGEAQEKKSRGFESGAPDPVFEGG